MTIPPTAPAPNNGEHTVFQTVQKHRLVVAAGVARLVCLVLLLVPQAIIWGAGAEPAFMFLYGAEYLYAGSLILGFALNIAVLLFWKRFVSTSWLVGTQVAADILVALVLVVLTGGVTSPLSFLFWGIVFFHGRVLGRQPSVAIGMAMAGLLGVLGLVQIVWPELWRWQSTFEQLGYYLSLQWLGLGLAVALVHATRGETEKLFAQLRRQERALEEAEALKAKVLDWMDSGLIVLNPEGNVLSANRQALIVADIPRLDSLIGHTIHEIYPAFEPYWQKWRQGKTPARDEVHDETGRVFGLRLVLAPDATNTLVLFADITEIRRLEKRVQDMEKMATIGELAAGLAHEMKNPLAGIKAGLQLAEDGELSAQHLQRLHTVVQRDINRLDALLRDFLAFARPSPPTPNQVRLGEVVDAVLGVCRYEFPAITFECQERLWQEVWNWDRQHLHQVLLNLVRNGAEAVADQTAGTITVGVRHTGQLVCLWVQDTGPGFSAADQQRVFDPFVTTKEQGSGLGLSIAQRLAHQNHSWIEAENGPSGAEMRLCRTVADG